MKKQLLLMMAACIGATSSAFAAYEEGDYVYTSTGKYRIDGANMLPNGDFSNGTAEWTNLTGGALTDTVTVITSGGPEGMPYLQISKGGGTMGTSLSNSSNFRCSYELAPGSYIFTYKVKSSTGGVLSNARSSGRNDNYQDVYINSDGTCPFPTETDNNKITASVAEWLDLPAGEWVTINYYYSTAATEHVNFEFFNVSVYDCFTDFGVYPAHEVGNDVILKNGYDFLKDLSAGISAVEGFGSKVNTALIDEMALPALDAALDGSDGTLETPDGVNQSLGMYINNAGSAVDMFMTLGVDMVTPIAVNVGPYFSSTFNLDEGTTYGANKGVNNGWKDSGGRWGVQAPWANMTTNHIFASIGANYGLGEGAAYITTPMPAGKYAFIVQASAVKYYANGKGKTSNYYIPDYSNPRSDKELGFFINGDTCWIEDVPTTWGAYYYHVFDVAEGGDMTVGFARKATPVFAGNDRSNKVSGGGEVRFDVIGLYALGKTDADIEQFNTQRNFDNALNALEVMRDSAITLHNNTAKYVFGHEAIQDSIDVANQVIAQNTEVNQTSIDALNGFVSHVRNAINAFHTANAEYVDLADGIEYAKSYEGDENRPAGQADLSAAIKVAEGVHGSYVAPAQRTPEDSTKLVNATTTLNAAVQTFLLANATYQNPASIMITNADFSDNSNGWAVDPSGGNAAWKYGDLDTQTESGTVHCIFYNRGTVATDQKWLYQDVPVTATGAYEFFATIAVHNSKWNDLDQNTNTYLFLNKDSVMAISKGANSNSQTLGSFRIQSIVSNVKDLNDTEECVVPGHVRIGLEKRDNTLQLNMIYFGNPILYYYGTWEDYLAGIYDVEVVPTNASYDVYNLSGMKVRSNATSLDGLAKGIYIVNGKKVVVD